MNISNQINKSLLAQACLSATHWWVAKEYDHHTSFQQLKNSSKVKDTKIQDQFYNFTQEYSLLQGTSGNRKVLAIKTLKKLVETGFITTVLEAKINNALVFDIESYLHCTPLDKPQRSLLTKFATLLRPELYSMLDRFAVDSLSLLHKKTNGFNIYPKSRINVNYSLFMEAFYNYKNQLLTSDHKRLIRTHFAYLKDNFNCPISLEAYQNRVCDKVLWHNYNTRRDKTKQF